MDITIVTGLSGAGKSTALNALEDLGAYCVDNLPVAMLGDLVSRLDRYVGVGGDLTESFGHARYAVLAVGIDVRDPELDLQFQSVVNQLRGQGHQVSVIFIQAPVGTLVRRYSETRRRHPLGDIPLAIERERKHLAPLKEYASLVIDTETLGPRQLRRIVRERFGTDGQLTLVLMSFGFKTALPSEADGVFDVRFLPNPYSVMALRQRTGLETEVQEYVMRQPTAQETLDRIESWVRFQVPLSLHEGRSALTLAIGCTGGQHRSVTLVEALFARLNQTPFSDSVLVRVCHRDVPERSS